MNGTVLNYHDCEYSYVFCIYHKQGQDTYRRPYVSRFTPTSRLRDKSSTSDLAHDFCHSNSETSRWQIYGNSNQWMWNKHLPVVRQPLRYTIATNQQAIRCWSSYDDGRAKSKKRQKFELSGKVASVDPFVALGIVRSPSLKYTTVKSTFLKIAMKYHPDTTQQKVISDDEREKNKDLFVMSRKAFEAIMAGPDGIAILKTEADDYVEEEENFEEWFKSETGYDMPFMDAATMREVAEMTDTVGGGLDRDGGMWTLARMIANTVKAGGDVKSVLQLDAGVVRDRSVDGILRRKRRR
jgi:hypothetical protein